MIKTTGASIQDESNWNAVAAKGNKTVVSRSDAVREAAGLNLGSTSVAAAAAAAAAALDPAVADEMDALAHGGVLTRADFNERVVDALRCLPQEAALRALGHLAQAVSSIQISTVRSVPAYIMSIIAKHQPGRENRLRDNPLPPPPATQSRSAAPSPRAPPGSEAAGSTVEATLQAQLDAVVAAGLLQREDFNERIMAALRSMPTERAVRALQYLSRAVSAEQLSGVRNVGAYVMAMITDVRHAREGAAKDGREHSSGSSGHRNSRGGHSRDRGSSRSDRPHSNSATSPVKASNAAAPGSSTAAAPGSSTAATSQTAKMKQASSRKPPLKPLPQPPRLSANPPSGQTWAARLRGAPPIYPAAQAHSEAVSGELPVQSGASEHASPVARQMQNQAPEGHNTTSTSSDSGPASSPLGPAFSNEPSAPQHAQHTEHAQQAGVPLAAPGSGGIVITPEMISAVMAHLHSTGGGNGAAAAAAQLPQEQQHWQNGGVAEGNAASHAAAVVANGGLVAHPSLPEAQQVPQQDEICRQLQHDAHNGSGIIQTASSNSSSMRTSQAHSQQLQHQMSQQEVQQVLLQQQQQQQQQQQGPRSFANSSEQQQQQLQGGIRQGPTLEPHRSMSTDSSSPNGVGHAPTHGAPFSAPQQWTLQSQGDYSSLQASSGSRPQSPPSSHSLASKPAASSFSMTSAEWLLQQQQQQLLQQQQQHQQQQQQNGYGGNHQGFDGMPSQQLPQMRVPVASDGSEANSAVGRSQPQQGSSMYGRLPPHGQGDLANLVKAQQLAMQLQQAGVDVGAMLTAQGALQSAQGPHMQIRQQQTQQQQTQQQQVQQAQQAQQAQQGPRGVGTNEQSTSAGWASQSGTLNPGSREFTPAPHGAVYGNQEAQHMKTSAADNPRGWYPNYADPAPHAAPAPSQAAFPPFGNGQQPGWAAARPQTHRAHAAQQWVGSQGLVNGGGSSAVYRQPHLQQQQAVQHGAVGSYSSSTQQKGLSSWAAVEASNGGHSRGNLPQQTGFNGPAGGRQQQPAGSTMRGSGALRGGEAGDLGGPHHLQQEHLPGGSGALRPQQPAMPHQPYTQQEEHQTARHYGPTDATVKAYAQERAAAAEAREEDALLNEVAGLKTW